MCCVSRIHGLEMPLARTSGCRGLRRIALRLSKNNKQSHRRTAVSLASEGGYKTADTDGNRRSVADVQAGCHLTCLVQDASEGG